MAIFRSNNSNNNRRPAFRSNNNEESYLAEFLLNKGYEVHGIKRRTSLINTDRFNHLYEEPHKTARKFILYYN